MPKKNLQHLHRSRLPGALLSHGYCCRQPGLLGAAGDAEYCRLGLLSLKRTIGLIRGDIEQRQLEVCETWRARRGKARESLASRIDILIAVLFCTPVPSADTNPAPVRRPCEEADTLHRSRRTTEHTGGPLMRSVVRLATLALTWIK